MTRQEYIHYALHGILLALLVFTLLIFTFAGCSGHEAFEDHQKFLRESCLVSGGRWDNVSDECIEAK